MIKSELSPKYREANKIGLRNEIRKARDLTDGIIGVNIMVAISDFDAIMKVAFDEKVDIVFLGAGLPLKIPSTLTIDQLKLSKTKVGVIVSSARATRIIFQSWQKNFNHVPDVVVVEGPKAGGHLGFKRVQIDNPDFSLENIVPDVLSTVIPFEHKFKKEIPVVAAGGVFSGKDILKYLELGAKGIQMATRFVATFECEASDEFKNSYINSKKEDLIIIQSPLGLPGRAIRNKYLDEVERGERKPFTCSWKCIKTCDFNETPYCIAKALTNAQQGNMEDGFTFAGANAYRVEEIVSVKEIFNRLQTEYEKALYDNLFVSSNNEQAKVG
jgi:NAD(P)H-dependent flavin oxidoreductase YrpB (nitropropane dioxygenase family)